MIQQYTERHGKPPSKRTIWLLGQQAAQNTRRSKAEARRTVAGQTGAAEPSNAQRLAAWEAQLDRAGLKGDVDLAARFEELARTVANALDSASPKGPAAPYWLDLDRAAYAAQLAELRGWIDTVLRPNYGGYELRDCWPSHIHVIWELSTLAAEWHRTYSGQRPDLPRALEFYDRWLPGTMRRVNEFTRACAGQCGLSRRIRYDWTTQ